VESFQLEFVAVACLLREKQLAIMQDAEGSRCRMVERVQGLQPYVLRSLAAQSQYVRPALRPSTYSGEEKGMEYAP